MALPRRPLTEAEQKAYSARIDAAFRAAGVRGVPRRRSTKLTKAKAERLVAAMAACAECDIDDRLRLALDDARSAIESYL